MSFDDLEKILRQFFLDRTKSSNIAAKTRIRERTLAAYEQKYSWHQKSLLFFQHHAGSLLACVFVIALLGVVDTPLTNNKIVAGKIKTKSGIVEIIRGNESFLVTEEASLLVGDFVRVKQNSQANFLSDYFVSQLDEGTNIEIIDKDVMVLERGKWKGYAQKGSKIQTRRGWIKGLDSSGVVVHVSESGETTITPLENQVSVYDLHRGKLIASAGETIKLRSDTRLKNVRFPEDLNLSKTQEEAILGKLAITRTKILTGVQKMLLGKRTAAHRNIASAEKSFLSVLQVLNSSRNLEITRTTNLDNVPISAVFSQLQEKTSRVDLLTETKGLESLFTVMIQNKNNIAFAPVDTGVESYDRYVILHYLASLGAPKEAALITHLADNYVISLLRKVQNQPIKIDQISLINEQIDKLPVNQYSEQFLKKLEKLLAPDVAKVVNEKIEYLF